MVQDWLAAAADPAIAGEIEAVYADLARAIAERGPMCRASGRCCNFEQHGHRLYVTGLEAAYALARLEAGRAPTPESLEAARARGGCPFQSGTLCSIHAIKPLGCRVYFCDPAAEGWQQEQSERLLARLRALHERHGIEYRYGEWRAMLAMFL